LDYDALPSTIMDEIERARGAFEAAWRAGQRPRIEGYLAGKGESYRAALLHAILASELDLRTLEGDSPLPDDYLKRFPADAETIRELFEERSTVTSATVTSAEKNPPDSEASSSTTTYFLTGTESPLTATPRADSGRAPSREESPDVPEVVPDRIGRYGSIRLLGQGGYGRVYLARDGELGRAVAIKVLRASLIESVEQIQGFLSEAQMAAGLKHPAIVTVHDAGQQEGVGPFIVMEYIEGQSLNALFHAGRPAPDRLATLIARVADAVHYAHGAGLVHRDLKPGNILIDKAGEPHVTDFGMAVTEDLQRLKAGEIAGTPHFMAPEQVRGETHRLDGRTDLWGLGVILYLGLTGHLPFEGNTRSEVFKEILHRDPRRPRLIDPTIPPELERICLKCLSKRMTERYLSGRELAEDLRSWMAESVRQSRSWMAASASFDPALAPHKIVPKGLRSFDSEDADFFLELLPGPRDRYGLPEPIRFWKTRIEEADDEKAFTVGVIYGPSGCGKTSVVRAGLLPRLGQGVHPIYVEAAAAGTEARLLAALRRAGTGLPEAARLAEAIAEFRAGRCLPRGDKLLIVLDQFEQWLHAHPDDPDAELTCALRQCDGRRVQCLILVRDDFWMSISRFMRALEVRLVEGRNSAAVELFDPVHARKVLAEFGRAWGRLPDDPAALSSDQARFLDRAVAELSRRPDGWIIPVRLSLFAEMVRGRPWVPATLREVGGTAGIGVRFLEETFCGSMAPPEHRLHQGAARAVLKALLPDSSTVLKGAHRSSQELMEAAGYSRRAEEFHVLMRILDGELRLITPTESAEPGEQPGAAAALPTQPAYQLAHDTLVPSVRQWLTRKQQETLRGRAELRLAERADFWNSRPEPRQLASVAEWLQILFWTRGKDWTAPQRKMMVAATRRYLAGGLIAAVVLCGMVLGAFALRKRLEERQKATQADGLIAQLNVADMASVPAIIGAMEDYRPWLDGRLAEIAADSRQAPRMRQRANLASLPSDPSRAGVILEDERFFQAEPDELVVVCRLLLPFRSRLISKLWTTAAALRGSEESPRLIRTAAALAAFDPDGAGWQQLAAPATDQLLKENVLQVRAWTDALRPARHQLLAALGSAFRDPARSPTERSVATGVLRDYTLDDPAVLIELVKDADPEQFAVLEPGLARHRAAALEAMVQEVARIAPATETDANKERLAHRQENAAIGLLRMGRPEPVWPLLKHSPDPRLRSQLVCNLGQRGVPPQVLVERLRVEPDVSARRALLLALAGYKSGQLAMEAQLRLVEDAAKLYRDDPDSGIHAAARCLLLRWAGDRVGGIDRALQHEGQRENRSWYLNPEGHTMVVVTPRSGAARRFAIASHEVTIAQFRRFRADHETYEPYSYRPDCPVGIVTWYGAVAYCRWLSEQEHIPEDQMCYPPIEEIKDGMVLYPDYLQRTGYRLPAEGEWSEACAAGATTRRFFGSSAALMRFYACSRENSVVRLPNQDPIACFQPVGRLLPNDLGLFDTLGNANEWCQDGIERDLGPGIDPLEARPIRANQRRRIKGGPVTNSASAFTTDAKASELPAIVGNSLGFRVARTYPLATTSAAR
jgi:formylglycine-generating enzyme required for sulfatase activity